MTWPLCWPLCRWWRWSRVSLRLTGWKAWCLAGRWVASGHFSLSCCVRPEMTLCDWPDFQIQELTNLSCPVVSIVCVDGVFLCDGRFAALLWLCLLKGVTFWKEWLWLCWIYSKIVTTLWPCKKREWALKESVTVWELPEGEWQLRGRVARKSVTVDRKWGFWQKESDRWKKEWLERERCQKECDCWQKESDRWKKEWLLRGRGARKSMTVDRK